MIQTFIITRGLPASGKSTFAVKMLEKLPDTIRVERDLLRDQLYNSRAYSAPEGSTPEEIAAFSQYLRDREATITQIQRSMVEVALTAGKNVIVSDTNLRASYVKDWYKLANKFGVVAEVIDFSDVSVDECIRRDAVRDNSVGETVIRDMYKRFFVKGKLPKVKESVEDVTAKVQPYVPVLNTPKAIIVDIDGTLAQMQGRSPYDWHRVGEDTPVEAVMNAVHAASQFNRKIIVMSGRDEACHDITKTWLTKHLGVSWHELHMRPEGDNRKDNIIKQELFDKHVRTKYHVEYILDDRDQVVKMWRAMGIPTFQVAEGNF
jgi:predicted kinase